MIKKINTLTVKSDIDIHTNLDHLGAFSDEAGKYAIEHKNNDGRSYKYFNADNVENMEEAKENYKIVMEYETHQRYDIGVKAYAEIQTGDLVNTISSGGLWGISNDISEEELKEVEEEQLIELEETLKALGFTNQDIDRSKTLKRIRL